MTWSYEANPACNVLVGDSSEVTAAKSTVPETNKSSSNRPKTSTASTTSSTSSQPSSSSGGGSGSGGSSSSNSNTNAGGKISSYDSEKMFRRRHRRNAPSFAVDGSGDGDGSLTVPPLTAATSSSMPSSTNDLSLHAISWPDFDGHYPIDTHVTVDDDEDEPDGSSDDDNDVVDDYGITDRTDRLHVNRATVDISNAITNSPISSITSSSSISSVINDNRNNIGDGLPVNIVDGTASSQPYDNVFDVTHGTNVNENLIDTNSTSDTEAFDLITDVFNGSNESIPFDMHTNNTVDDVDGDSDATQPGMYNEIQSIDRNADELLQNDAPTIIVGDQSIADHVNLNDIDDDNDMPSKSNDDGGRFNAKARDIVEIHPLQSHTKVELPTIHENDINKYSYVETAYPEHTYYQMHDNQHIGNLNVSNNDTMDVTTHQPMLELPQQQMQRILVNVSIATDTGSGSQTHGVYMLHVSVPAGPDYLPVPPAAYISAPHTVNSPPQRDDPMLADDRPPEIPPQPPCPCQCADEAFATAATVVTTSATTVAAEAASSIGSNDIDALNRIEAVSTTDASDQEDSVSTMRTTDKSIVVTDESTQDMVNASLRPCIDYQDIPTILILEGERR